jgi:hypothetical protein
MFLKNTCSFYQATQNHIKEDNIFQPPLQDAHNLHSKCYVQENEKGNIHRVFKCKTTTCSLKNKYCTISHYVHQN